MTCLILSTRPALPDFRRVEVERKRGKKGGGEKRKGRRKREGIGTALILGCPGSPFLSRRNHGCLVEEQGEEERKGVYSLFSRFFSGVRLCPARGTKRKKRGKSERGRTKITLSTYCQHTFFLRVGIRKREKGEKEKEKRGNASLLSIS